MTYGISQKINATNYIKANKEFIALLVISCIAAFFFVFKGMTSRDSIRYLIGLQTVLEKGIVEVSSVFNGEMSFGYYLLLSFLDKLLGEFVSLSSLMNNLNAAVSVVLQGSLFLFFNSLYDNKKLSFFTCLAVLLSPSIWMLSHCGHPGLISLTFFIGSLLVYDKIIHRKTTRQRSGFLWLYFIVLSTIAVSIRLDIVLAFGAYFGLLYFKRALSKSNFLKTFGALIIVLFLLLGLRYLVLGYLINPSGGTFAFHIASRLEPEFILRNIIKNYTVWTLSLNLFIVFLAGLGLFRLGFISKLGVLLFSWIIPWNIFIVFRDMEIGRIIAPTIPIVSLVAVVYVISVFKKRQVLVLSFMLILTHVTAMALYHPLTKVYPFKKEVDGRVLAAFPIGSLFVDHHYRQRAITFHEHIAKLVASEIDENVMIIGGNGLLYYQLYLIQFRNVLSIKIATCNGVKLKIYTTTENEFYILDIDENWLVENPIRKAIDYMNSSQINIHIVPYWKEYPTYSGEIFLNKQAIQSVFESEASIMKVRKKMIHY